MRLVSLTPQFTQLFYFCVEAWTLLHFVTGSNCTCTSYEQSWWMFQACCTSHRQTDSLSTGGTENVKPRINDGRLIHVRKLLEGLELKFANKTTPVQQNRKSYMATSPALSVLLMKFQEHKPPHKVVEFIWLFVQVRQFGESGLAHLEMQKLKEKIWIQKCSRKTPIPLYLSLAQLIFIMGSSLVLRSYSMNILISLN